jgi:NTP pyrophosphatase (non-canonical NTP hydrolase)
VARDTAMSDDQTTIDELKRVVDHFVRQRDWQQFHTPKNLSMALAIEAAELMEHFQWLTAEQSRDVARDAVKRGAVGEELADVVCYALAMANELGIDVSIALRDKMAKNAQKYPADEYRGRWGAEDRPRS